ncbi:MAG: hypothetical protein IT463_13710 [Planctomycetes bacterium]|nr:hypothetical protein [Planctomycetota bacterium]
MNKKRIGAALVVLAVFALGVRSQDAEPPSADDALLEAYRTGKTLAQQAFWSLHGNAGAGQGARYRDFDGTETTYRVAFLRGNVCTVEQQLRGSEVVLALEFEVNGPIDEQVRRAWVGRRGEAPFAAKVEPMHRGAGGVGGGGNCTVSHERFADLDQGGRKWSGNLKTTKYRRRIRDKEFYKFERIWTSDEHWFNHAIRQEIEVIGQEIQVAELVECSDSMAPLLDWSGIPAPTPEEEAAIRAPLLQVAVQLDLQRMISGNLSFGNLRDLHPGAKVGDWASYGGGTKTLVKLEQGRGIIESEIKYGDLVLVEAVEFNVTDGKAGDPVARWVGMKGTVPQRAKLGTSTYTDDRPLETTVGEWKQVTLAGRQWRAREVVNRRTSKNSVVETPQVEVEELLECEEAPFGRHLKYKRYWTYLLHQTYTRELTACGDGGTALLDWSSWTPSVPARPWKAPFTADDVKAFVKVGMRWRYSLEYDKGADGKEMQSTEWKVTKVTEKGYDVEAVFDLGVVDGENRTVTQIFSYTWDYFDDRVASWSGGTMEDEKLKLGDKEISVVIFRFRSGHQARAVGLSADLPGVQIRVDEEVNPFPTKMWLTEFHYPDEKPAEGK